MKTYRDWSIKIKLLTMTSFIILFSVFLVSFFSYIRYTQDFQRQSADKVQLIIEQVALNMDTYLDELFRLSIAPYQNDRFMRTLEEDAGDSPLQRLQKTRDVENFLDDMLITPRRDILRVFILTDREIFSSGRVLTDLKPGVDYKASDWYQKALTTQEPVFVPAHYERMVAEPRYQVFSIVKQLRSIKDTEKILGVIKVDANYKGIEAIGDRVRLGNDGGLFIIDENENIIYSNLHDSNERVFFQHVRDSQSSFTTVKLKQGNYLLNTTSIERAGWTIVAVNSLRELNRNAVATRNTAFFMAVISALLGIFILVYFVRSFTKPLLHIVELMREIDSGKLNVTFPDIRNDEIGYLGSSFNEMVKRIRNMLQEKTRLVKEIYETKYLQKEAQMNALFNQIKPHFIFNTLNMISLLIQSGQEQRGIQHINQLSKILRKMTLWEKEVSLKDELDLVESYLSIQASRFERRLKYEIDVDPSLYDYRIPSFLFQPIVENAVLHGCETRQTQTTIRIGHRIGEDKLVFFIEDDGRGMEDDVLRTLCAKIKGTRHASDDRDAKGERRTGIGLVNVHRRIQLKYGKRYGLDIHSKRDQGTCVEITLPPYERRMPLVYDDDRRR